MSRRDRLLSRLRRLALVKRQVRLASGQTSSVYVDIKGAVLGDPLTMDMIALTVVDAARERRATQIGGLELGAAPITAAAVCRSVRRYPLAGVIVRKGERDHGLGKRIEGTFDPKAATLLIDDVTTTGGSLVAALAAAGVELVALATLAELTR